jgi:general secretion pathway protein N
MLRRLPPAQRLPVLLAAVGALWAFLFLVAALAGLGGRYRLHPDDPSQVPPLPRIDLSQARSPLESLDAYAQIGQRPLFNPDRRPVPPPESSSAGADAAPPPAPTPLDVTLTSVVMSGAVKIAIVTDNKTGNSQSVKIGDALSGDSSDWKLVELAPRKAVFEGPQGRSEAELRVFDGSGGQAPTPTAVAAAAPEQTKGQRAAPPPPESAANAAPQPPPQPEGEQMTPEQRSEMIRKRIEERRRQMREEAERTNRK